MDAESTPADEEIAAELPEEPNLYELSRKGLYAVRAMTPYGDAA